MIGFMPPADTAALIARMADPAIRIVSLTVTEGGYIIDPATGQFDPQHPRHRGATRQRRTIPHRLRPDPARPQALAAPRGVQPFTVMSCDNIPHNGVVTRKPSRAGAALSIRGWPTGSRHNVAFPNGMVDRITPATRIASARIVADDFGIDDTWPVSCEEFRQWVLEDSFPQGRPALEEVGVHVRHRMSRPMSS